MVTLGEEIVNHEKLVSYVLNMFDAFQVLEAIRGLEVEVCFREGFNCQLALSGINPSK